MKIQHQDASGTCVSVTSGDDQVSLFSSARERRLWVWTLAVVVAIYSTLGLARNLAGVLRSRNLLDPVDIPVNALAGTMAVVASLALGWIRQRSSGRQARPARNRSDDSRHVDRCPRIRAIPSPKPL